MEEEGCYKTSYIRSRLLTKPDENTLRSLMSRDEKNPYPKFNSTESRL